MSIRVLVADDQSMVRAGFRMLLSGEEDIEVVAEASNGLEAIEKAARFDPTVDPHGHPHARARRARGDAADPRRRPRRPRPHPHDLRPRRVRLRGAASRGERLRPQGRSSRAADRGGPDRLGGRCASLAHDHETSDQGSSPASPVLPPPKELDDLSERERDVFRLIARGLSNAEIGQELYISETTVKTHVTHILQKLDLRDRVQAVVLAYQAGFFEPEPVRSSGRDETPAG